MDNLISRDTSIPKIIPFKELLSRLESSLSAINSKTKPFQVSYPTSESGQKDSATKSEFELELIKLVELAEEIKNNLPF